jgi:CHAT domain-containing protein
MSLVQLFLRNIELSKKYAELSNNKALITLCLIQDNKPKEADLIFTELMDDLNKEFKVNSNLSIYDNLLLKRNLLVFNVTASMNYINYWKIKRPELVRFVFEKWINFNGDINTTNYLSDKNASELGRLKDRKNKIEENMLTPSKIKILKSCKDSISYLEQTLLSTIKLSHTKINVSDIQNKLTKDDIYIDIVQVPNFDFKKIKIVDGNIYNVFIVKRGVDDSINHILISSEINMNFDNKNTDDLVLFYKYFWKPIADKIGDTKTIYVSLGGIYNNINLSTIYNPETGKYLLEERDIRIVNSARDFVLSKEKEKKNYTTNTASLFGFPDFDGNTSISSDTMEFYASTRDLNSFWLDSLTRGGLKANPLPATKIEVENISLTLKSKGWQVNSFLAENASETNIKKQESPRILHIATHGYFFPDIPIDKDNTRFLGMDRQQVVQDPMLRSGLLLTGANKTLKGETTSGENGLLTAAEASLLDLRETELVVLSACETGKGEIKNSEGVYGLRKAFADAGAQNIIMSLWKVDDKVTQEFMSRFYENWLNDKTSIREAFNKTQLEIKAKYPQPYYWGAFILVGE